MAYKVKWTMDTEVCYYCAYCACSMALPFGFKFTAEIGELEATKMQHQHQIRDLESQLARLQDRVNVLESAKRALESQNQAQNAEVSTQVHTLQMVIICTLCGVKIKMFSLE